MRQNWQFKCLWGEFGLDQSGGSLEERAEAKREAVKNVDLD